MEVKDLVLEIGSEEMPSYAMEKIIHQLGDKTLNILKRENLWSENIETYGTPRRLVVFIKNLATKTKEITQEIMGPDIQISFDEKGNPTSTALGFAKSHQAKVTDLKIKETPKGKRISISKVISGKDTACLLPIILPEIINSLSLPKTMRWEAKDIKFIRPIRWILCLWGEERVNFSLGNIISSVVTYGHRFKTNQGIEVAKGEDFFKVLRDNYVILDQKERKAHILSQLKKKTAELKAILVEDEELLERVTYLTEYPSVYLGRFNQEFVNLPQEVLITSLKEHQRCFSLKDTHHCLLPYFLLVSNSFSKEASGNIIQGNERVVLARLTDASFFFKEDQKVLLKERVEKEKNIIWQNKLGSLWDKTQRLINLAEIISKEVSPNLTEAIKRAAFLCKADLSTEMVKEFPNLQGIMGYYYAKAAGEKEEVALAIKDHYLPRFAEDTLPQNKIGAILGISDRLDTLVGCFSLGISYHSSQDPYGFRRQAQGIINILLNFKIDVSLDKLIDESLNIWEIKEERERLKGNIKSFLEERIKFIFSQRKIDLDIIEAVSKNFSLPNRALEISYLIKENKQQKEFLELATALKRIYNILQKNTYEGKIKDNLLLEEGEKKLFEIYQGLKGEILKMLLEQRYQEALDKLTCFTQPINYFFDKVMVMVEDEELRQNRLALLYQIKDLSLKLIDFSNLKI
ncbi:glycine--tRNA ligase subunit beta [bacterium]|nr:glycine--tRNA ligase subunit beta [bacterium]